MADTLPFLIDKQDGFEIVRDQIGLLLVENQAAQVALATTASKPDPDEWKLRVFLERSNPWEQFTNAPEDAVPDQSPIVNVWYESGSFPTAKGNTIARQDHEGTFNIDVYGWGLATELSGGGHTPGDLDAALIAQRGTRLCRNILLSAQNAYLQLRQNQRPDVAVGMRWVQSITSFQPEIQNESAHAIVGIRLALRVQFSEFAQQADETNLLDFIAVDIHRASDGMLIAEADFDLT